MNLKTRLKDLIKRSFKSLSNKKSDTCEKRNSCTFNNSELV